MVYHKARKRAFIFRESRIKTLKKVAVAGGIAGASFLGLTGLVYASDGDTTERHEAGRVNPDTWMAVLDKTEVFEDFPDADSIDVGESNSETVQSVEGLVIEIPETVYEPVEEIPEEETEASAEETPEENIKETVEETEPVTETVALTNEARIENTEKKVSFNDIREDFWISDYGVQRGGIHNMPSGFSAPNVWVYDDYILNGVNDANWLSYAVSVNATYFKYFGEMAVYIDDYGTYWYNGAENKSLLEKNRWTEDKIVSAAANLVHKGMSEREAVDAIINFIRNRFSAGDDADGQMYNLWSSGHGNCESYSRTFKEMCNYVGIECQYLEGMANGYHAWNRVKINNTWYYVDTTWYDTSDDMYYLSENLWNDHGSPIIII